MGRQKKLSKLSDSDEEYLKKKSKKERSLAVDSKARFDQEDVDNLTLLFETYNRYTGGRLRKMIEQNRLERALNDRSATEDSISKAENLSFFMPKDLQEEVERYWPTLWTNKVHLRAFLKAFPELRR